MNEYHIIQPSSTNITNSDSKIKTETKEKKSIAGFDIDYTIIRPKSGRKFPKDKDDWIFMYEEGVIKEKLKEIGKTHQIVFFTNQKKFNEDLGEKFTNIVNNLNLDITIFVGSTSGYYRKPFTGLWDLLKDKVDINKESSFYCGDAAGRKGDFAATDKMFAYNIGIKFKLPEEVFLNQTINLIDIETNRYLKPYLQSSQPDILDHLKTFGINKESKNIMILMMGYPGSGKSKIAQLISDNYKYEIVSRDLLKTKSKCQREIKKHLLTNKNIVVDATNYSKKMRAESIEIVKNSGYQIIVLKLENSIESSFYMNQYRCQINCGKNSLIPKVAYYKIRKKMSEEFISLDEGINKILEIVNYLNINENHFQFEII